MDTSSSNRVAYFSRHVRLAIRGTFSFDARMEGIEIARIYRSAVFNLKVCRDSCTLWKMADCDTAEILINYSGKSSTVDNSRPSFETIPEVDNANGLPLLVVPKDFLYDESAKCHR